MKTLDAVVLGAGAAGLCAAVRLSRAGRRVAVLEARGRVGGRMLTEKGPEGPVELGAEFVHGKPPELWGELRRLGLRTVEIPDVHLLKRGRRFVSEPEFWERVERVLGRLRERTPDRSFDEATRSLRLNPLRRGDLRLARDFIAGFHAADPARASETALARLAAGAEESEEERSFRLLDGYGALAQAWAAELPEGTLRLGTRAVRVRWRRGLVEVEALSGRRRLSVRARRAVIALPLGVLKSGTPAFEPALGAKRAALDGLEMGFVVKAVAQLERGALERLGVGRASFLHDPESVPAVWWTQAPEQTASLTAWVGGPKAAALAARGPAAVEQEVLRGLSRLLGPAGRRAVTRVRRHDWGADPDARGAYSWAAKGGAEAHRRLGRPLEGTLFFAGEAADAEGQSATTAGAVATGFRSAEAILRLRR